MNFATTVRYLGAALLVLAAGNAVADGRQFVHGRFPAGKSTVMTLTPKQRALVVLFHRCRSDNTKTPYIFRLTPQQAITLKRSAGRSPSRFAIFDSYQGDKAVDLESNVIVRFAADKFEVPHDLLISDKAAHDYEVNVIGWAPNPLESIDPSSAAIGACPN